MPSLGAILLATSEGTVRFGHEGLLRALIECDLHKDVDWEPLNDRILDEIRLELA